MPERKSQPEEQLRLDFVFHVKLHLASFGADLAVIEKTTMSQPDSNAMDTTSASPLAPLETERGVRFQNSGHAHPLLIAIEKAPFDPISDEENALLDDIHRSTAHWLTDEEFRAATVQRGLHCCRNR